MISLNRPADDGMEEGIRTLRFLALTGENPPPMKPDSEAPPVDHELIRKMFLDELPSNEANEVFLNTIVYNTWKEAAAVIGREVLRNDSDDDSSDQ